MTIDIVTLSVILSLTNLLQIIAIYLQYRINRSSRGLGWWLLGFVSIALSFTVVSFSIDTTFSPNAILINNLLFVFGMMLLYVGILRFLGRDEKRLLLIIGGFVFLILMLLLNIRYPRAQSVVLSIAVAALSILTAVPLLASYKKPIKVPSHFLAAIFLANGLLFLVRGISYFVPLSFMLGFDPSAQQTLVFLVILCVSVLWTFGFIILINQSLQVEKQEAANNLQLIYDTNPDAIVVTRCSDSVLVDVNAGFLFITGYTREEVIGKTMANIGYWHDLADRQKMLRSLKRKGSVENLEALFVRKNGSQFIGSVSARWFTMREIQHILTVTHDITRSKTLENQLRDNEEKYRFMTENTADVLFHLDKNFCFDYISPSDERMRGFTSKEVIGLSAREFIKAEIIENLVDLAQKSTANEPIGGSPNTINYELEVARKDGSYIWTDMSLTPHFDQEGRLLGIHGISRDITERKRLQDELEKMANTDGLTGIYNRRYFLEATSIEMKRAARHHRDLSLVLVDIDHLKQVNDSHGHAAGDLMLRSFAEICLKNIRTEDVLARFGGDEFILLFPETPVQAAYQIIERIRQLLSESSFQHQGQTIAITISAGLATLNGGDETIDTLIGRADEALYEAKKDGRNRVKIHSNSSSSRLLSLA